jgi:hypothetical protein
VLAALAHDGWSWSGGVREDGPAAAFMDRASKCGAKPSRRRDNPTSMPRYGDGPWWARSAEGGRGRTDGRTTGAVGEFGRGTWQGETSRRLGVLQASGRRGLGKARFGPGAEVVGRGARGRAERAGTRDVVLRRRSTRFTHV